MNHLSAKLSNIEAGNLNGNQQKKSMDITYLAAKVNGTDMNQFTQMVDDLKKN